MTSAAEWRNRRRGEILEDFQREIYGRTPKNVPKVTWEVVKSETGANGEFQTITKQLLGRVDNSAYPAVSVNIQATLTTPADARGPVPVIIQFGGGVFPLPENVPAAVNPARRLADSAHAPADRAVAPVRARVGLELDAVRRRPHRTGSSSCWPRAGATRP